MQRDILLDKLALLKDELSSRGFKLIGLFGSYARNNSHASSDIDLLYEIEDIQTYLKEYSGWNSINHLVETKEYLSKVLGQDVDFADIHAMDPIIKKGILMDLIYV